MASDAIPTAAPGSGRQGLDRRKIVGGAVSLIDEFGLKALTMRRLGEYLDVEAMAIYHHIRGREQLLDAVVEAVIDELYADPEVHLHSTEWQEYLYRLAHGVRRIALAHPEVFPLVCTRPPEAPWVRPPLRSLRWMESFLETLHRCGFSDGAAVAAYQAFSSFLLGNLLLEVANKGVDISPVEQADVDQPSPPDGLDSYPRLRQLQPLLSRDRSAEIFAESLEVLTDHLENLGKR
ncbi:TetR/AcrR family transcriptional regulator C-terminal domain-containing protein [Nakamurella flava]|uniref:TetR/AcrR family transcriptional regulator C-terminal domain-containing protein n=1 Tax=Nakamurella flava TaxID=2576308 RepID=UPI00197C83B1|nr:TetR/AcrR family transcriptional regulator C-terminal domain-containing protein [Nakamurella flava]